MNIPMRDNRILPITRIVAILIVPVLVLAFIILYFFPHLSGVHFSWEIKPSLMAVYMGSGYLGGSFLFLQTAIGKQWHRVAGGYLAVTAFTTFMMIATILHWERFDIGHFPFQMWLFLYAVTPFLVPYLWWMNKKTDPQTPESDDVIIPGAFLLGVRLLGVSILLLSTAGFIFPNIFIQIWPWSLTPLLARILAGWGGLLGVGNLAISFEKRWSAWRVLVVSIAIWHILYLIGSFFYRSEFTGGSWFNWHTVSVIGILVVIMGMYFWLEQKRKKKSA